MAHQAQYDFMNKVHTQFPSYFNKSKVLEVGSYNINGTLRTFFNEPSLYIGLDLAMGRDVDIVCSGHLYDSDERFDTLLSSECFEHNEYWKETIENMIRLSRKYSLIIFTCATNNRPEHGTNRTSPLDSLTASSSDYYKNLGISDFISVLDFNKIFLKYSFEINMDDLYFWGIVR